MPLLKFQPSYIFCEGSSKVCYCYKGNSGIRGKCNSIFWGPYSFKCLQLVKYCFKCDFELILYHVCMNKWHVTCAAVCSCREFTLWSFSVNPVFSTPLHEQRLKYHNISWYTDWCIFRKLYVCLYDSLSIIHVFLLFTCTIYYSI